MFARYKKAQDICASLRGNQTKQQFTVRIKQKDVAIKTRKMDEQNWKDITRNYIHELDDWELEKEWNSVITSAIATFHANTRYLYFINWGRCGHFVI